MTSRRNQSALLAKYHQLYQKNPRSKVFAPLAESYRKLGMIDEALKILKEGIKSHPGYALGYIVLSNCYFDEKKFELCYNTLRPLVGRHQDNISLQKLFAQTCLQLSHLDEALETYKYLLFMNPHEKFFAEQVKKLEDDLYQGQKIIGQEKLIKAPDSFGMKPLVNSFDDDWVQVDFSNQDDAKVDESLNSSSEVDDEWVMQKPGERTTPVEKQEERHLYSPPMKLSLSDLPEERDLDDEYYADEFEEYGEIEEVNSNELTADEPIISHTLIDLYCAQKYYDKAIELLDKILSLNPADQATVAKKKQVLSLKAASTPVHDSSEEEGHQELISLIETQVKAKTPEQEKLEQVFEQFLLRVQKRAEEVRLS